MTREAKSSTEEEYMNTGACQAPSQLPSFLLPRSLETVNKVVKPIN